MIDASISIVLTESDLQSLRRTALALNALAPSNRIVLFSDCHKALEHLRLNRADMLIFNFTDMNNSAPDLIGSVRELQPWIKLVCMSDNSSDAFELMRLKVDDFIVKPCSDEALLHVLLSAPGGC